MSPKPKRKPNRLINETSPYLQQHAYNPVDWYPWGPEAFEKAKAENRPVFLSVGYSACHWCHVMEHESFEDDEIADLMNSHFINIKVDREERPDVDQIYMNAVVAMTQRGGWPMSVFLCDGKPFFGGTYWPPESRMGMPGFRDILKKVHEAWTTRREDVEKASRELTAHLTEASRGGGRAEQALTDSHLQFAMRMLLRTCDRTHGGFGTAPKFPHPMDLRLLLRATKRFGNEDALAVVRLTLDKMAAGGIYDHLGGGFHRYSTDARWLVPHFEKMLYDNALLTSTYLEAFQATGNDDYARVARETLDYVLREMTQPDGGFYSTQDADSEGVEGKFFVWSEEEIVEILGSDDARHFNYCYDVTPNGNWEGHNILNRVKPHEQAARMLGADANELANVLARARQKLFEARSKRVAPGRDDKVLVSWNGLMIVAMAQAAQALGEAKYGQAAVDAADFVLDKMRDADGRLLHSYKDGRARFNGYLDDYACFIDGLVEVYQATFEARYLDAALDLAERMIARFHDADGGGFYYTSDDHEELITRHKDSQDNATPSGNNMAATALLRLGRICGCADLEQNAEAALRSVSGLIAEAPMAVGQALIALDFVLGPAHEIVIADGDDLGETDRALSHLHARFLPNKVVMRKPRISDDELSPAVRPLLEGKRAEGAKVTIYICQRGTCGLPIVGVEAFRTALETMK